MNNTAISYDSISNEWAEFVSQDPSKRYVQYPWALRQLEGRIQGSQILDIGCGEGSLARILAQRGACVHGYDNSTGQISQARVAEEACRQGIEYALADPRDIAEKISPSRFDSAIAIAVLHYAIDQDHLEAFFSSTYQLLSPGAIFIALVFNPNFKRLGRLVYNRRYSREPDGQVRVDFTENDRIRCSVRHAHFSISDYESAARATGWGDLEWSPVTVSQEGKESLGDFWKDFEEDCPYTGFKVYRR